MRSIMFSFLLLLGWGTMSVGQETSAAYKLGPGDRLELRVVIWAEVARQYELWTAVSGPYAVQADGTVLLPIAGPINAIGKTPSALSSEISAALESRANLIETPATSVEIAEYRPFYIIGDVNRPGSYPTTPGLTLAQAFANAGGSSATLATPTAQSSMLRETANLQQVNADIFRERIRAARLEAEIAGKDTVEFPSNVSHPRGDRATAQIIAEETEVFRSRLSALELEAETLNELKDLLTNEITGLDETLGRLQTQLELARTRYENIETLVEGGRARATQLVDIQRDLFNLENKEIDLQNSMFRAQQRIKETERDIVALQTKRSTQAAVELQRVNADLERFQNQRGFLREAIAEAGIALPEEDTAEMETTYFVIKANDPEATEQPASAGDRVAPGDIIRVSQILLLDGS